jgi:hypothetical protein
MISPFSAGLDQDPVSSTTHCISHGFIFGTGDQVSISVECREGPRDLCQFKAMALIDPVARQQPGALVHRYSSSRGAGEISGRCDGRTSTISG